MFKASNRERILSEGLRLVHEAGFGATTVRDIVQAAGVPQGSFSNNFASKEAFGLEILDRHFEAVASLLDATLRNQALPPLARLRAYIAANIGETNDESLRKGCLLGNFSAELSLHSDIIRQRLVMMFGEIRAAITDCLDAAVRAGEVRADLDSGVMAGFVLASFEGAFLIAKAERRAEPLLAFERTLFEVVLR